MSARRLFVGVANDKGGTAKTLSSAHIIEELARPGTPAWNVVEVEARSNFTQELYRHPEGTSFTPIGLITQNDRTLMTEPSLAPLDRLWDLVPPETDTKTDSRIFVDFGASAFQSFLQWGLERRGLQVFRSAGYSFVFFIPVVAADKETADFFNMNAEVLLRLGKLVLIRNLREGANFSLLREDLVAKVPAVTLTYDAEVSKELMQEDGRRLTFRQLAATTSASRRARTNAEICADRLTQQLRDLLPTLGL